MRKAYDTFLQAEVPADLAAKSGGLERYRYECAHCGEEVRLAAAGSISMVPHFRHRCGNNDIECEKYLGQYGALNIEFRSRKSRNERAEFYFDKNTKMFYLGLRFSDDEITAYEQQATAFELSISPQEKAFFTLLINNRNFHPDIPEMIPIERFSYNYFLSNTLNNVKRKYELFKKDGSNKPTFFKIQGNDSNYKAKLVRSNILYTNVLYFVVFRNQYLHPRSCFLPNDIKVDDTFQFDTMGRKFLGKVLIITDKTAHIDSLMTLWGYQLEASEELILLWPPAAQKNEVSIIESSYAFLFSSFELEAHGNINVHSKDIKRITSGISKVSVNSRIKIYRKNAEIVIDKAEQYITNFDDLPVTEKHENVYTVPDDSPHFLFNRSGVTSISNGQSVTLIPGILIKYYRSGYLDGLVYPMQKSELSGERLLNDILAHYKRRESFSIEAFDLLELSEVAFQYIKSCIELELINSAAKRFIEDGLL